MRQKEKRSGSLGKRSIRLHAFEPVFARPLLPNSDVTHSGGKRFRAAGHSGLVAERRMGLRQQTVVRFLRMAQTGRLHPLRYGVTKLPLAQAECFRPAAYDEGSERVQAASYGHSPTPLSGHLNVGFTVDSRPSLDDAIRRVSVGTVPIATHLEGKLSDRVSDRSVRGPQIVRHASAHIRHASLHAPQCSGA
jgi:hypothetical protein